MGRERVAAAREPLAEILVERAPLDGENERVGDAERELLSEIAERDTLASQPSANRLASS